MIGLLVPTIALMAIWAPQLRFGTLALALWLAFDAVFFPHLEPATGWNHLLVGAALAVISLVPSPPRFEVPRQVGAEA